MPGTMPDSDDVGCDHTAGSRTPRWLDRTGVVWCTSHGRGDWGVSIEVHALRLSIARPDHCADGRGAGGAVHAMDMDGGAAGTDRYGGAWRDGDEDGDKLVRTAAPVQVLSVCTS
jgi:hypothetical protein